MSRDDHDGPRVSRFVWATLGLLAFNWLLETGVWTRAVVIGRPASADQWVLVVLAWGFVVGPNLLFGWAVWHGRSDGLLVGICLGWGLLSAVGSLVLVATAVADEIPGRLGIGMGMFWVIGWQVGTLAFTFTHRDG